MTLLIVISSIFVYCVIGAVVWQIWFHHANKNCERPYHDYCDHEISATFMGVAWPIVPLLYLIFIAGATLSFAIANFFIKEK